MRYLKQHCRPNVAQENCTGKDLMTAIDGKDLSFILLFTLTLHAVSLLELVWFTK